MTIFLIWLIIISAALAIYLILLYKKSRQGFRFQVKLTIIFILLVLVPGIPLTAIVSALATKSMEMFLLPGMDEPLLHSLDFIKAQLDKEAMLYFSDFDKSPSAEKFFNQHENVQFIGILRKLNDKFLCQTRFIKPGLTNDQSEIISQYFDTLSAEVLSANFLGENQNIFQSTQSINDSHVRVIAFEIGDELVSLKNELSQTIRVYNSLLLLKNSVMEEELIWTIGTIFIIILTLITIYAARKLSRGISEPILALTRGMKRMAGGELDSRVQVEAKDEIKFLVDSFNKMAHDLKISQEKLIRAEKLAAWQGLARRVSHEIKNSLTPIKISVRRLYEKFQVEEDEEHPLVAIQEEVDSLSRLAEEFSQFSRMPELKFEKTNLQELIRSVATLASSEPGAPKINLKLDSSVPPLLLDGGQFRRVLYNLLKNAIEASQPLTQEKDITITLETEKKENKKVKIEIADKGCGIPPEILDKIFEPNFTTKRRGMGLGLSIVKKIIEDHDGEIKFFSSPGKGTRVVILL